MSLRNDLEKLKARESPTLEDYIELLDFTDSLFSLLMKERKSKSAMNKKNRKLAARLGLNNSEV